MDQSQQQLLKSSNFISQILDQIKSNLIEQDDSRKQDGIDAVEYIEKAIDLRRVFRFLVDGIQTNRSLVQIQKQQIQRKKMYLEGLHYYKATLKSQITNSQLDVVDMTQYMESEGHQANVQVGQQKKTAEKIDWIEDYANEQQKLTTTMQQFKQRKQQIKQKQQAKQQLTSKLQQSQQKSTKSLPHQLKKLHQQLQQTTKLFGIKELDSVSLNEFKNKKIERIFSILFPLKVKEMLELRHNVVVTGQKVEEELQVTIEKGWCGEWYEYARRNKIMVEDRQFKFTITSLPDVQGAKNNDTLALSISRREEFTVQQIFNNLLLQQIVKPIYENPKNQMQINANSKYARLDWIGDVLGSNSCMISGKMFIDKIKERIFSLSLVKYALENVTKKVPTYFFPLFKGDEQGSKLVTFPILQNKKIIFTKCEKSQFQEYKQEVYIPEWVCKALNNQKILVQELKLQQKNQPNINLSQRKLLSSFIESNNLQDIQEKNVYEYYRFQVVVDKNLLTGFFLIPTDYPKKKSIVKLISFKKVADSHHILQIPRPSEMMTEKNQDDQTRVYTQELKDLQIQLNKRINIFFTNSSSNGASSQEESRKKQNFFIYFQINRLISLLVEKSLQKN